MRGESRVAKAYIQMEGFWVFYSGYSAMHQGFVGVIDGKCTGPEADFVALLHWGTSRILGRIRPLQSSTVNYVLNKSCYGSTKTCFCAKDRTEPIGRSLRNHTDPQPLQLAPVGLPSAIATFLQSQFLTSFGHEEGHKTFVEKYRNSEK